MSEPRRPPATRRAADKAARRTQLIRSTIDSIAKRGFADTTLANVAEGAGLSHGTVNFHFRSKEGLLVETLRFLSEEYKTRWARSLARAGPSAAQKLEALILVDLDPAVCNRKKIAVWFAFYGEAKSRPTYLELCGQRDQEHFRALRELCAELTDDDSHPARHAELVASALTAMTDGLWLALLINPAGFDRDLARRSVLAYLESTFPEHFPIKNCDAA